MPCARCMGDPVSVSRRGPARYKVTCELIVEVEHPDDLPAEAQRDFERREVPLPPLWEESGNATEAALQALIRPEALVEGIAGVAFVEATWGAEPLQPPPLWS